MARLVCALQGGGGIEACLLLPFPGLATDMHACVWGGGLVG